MAKVLPKLSVYALLLFSSLLWAFFSAPLAELLSESFGNVYTTLNGVFDDFLLIAQLSIAFATVSLAYSIAMIVASFTLGGSDDDEKSVRSR